MTTSAESRSTGDPMLPVPYRVDRVARDTRDVFTLDLVPASGTGSLAFVPGQFNMLYVFGVGEVPISISGDPTRSDRIVHTTRSVGVVTTAMSRLRRGDVVGLRGPFGAGWPVANAYGSDVVLVAGGIGLAPLRPVIYSILANRDRYGRVAILYGTRTPDDILYRKELEQWRARFDMEVEVTVDHAERSWRGSVGVVTALVRRARFDPYDTIAMMCGPEIMMRFAGKELASRGVAPDRLVVSMERNMKCAVGLCGHCQFGPTFVCKDGPVFTVAAIREWFDTREI